jgi:hypothetical protein
MWLALRSGFGKSSSNSGNRGKCDCSRTGSGVQQHGVLKLACSSLQLSGMCGITFAWRLQRHSSGVQQRPRALALGG